MLSLLLSLSALGREVVHEPRPIAVPEAFYVLGGPAWCRVAVVVGADGKPRDARARACSIVLSEGLEEAAMGWRWERAEAATTEVVEVGVRPPSFTPRAPRGECLVAYQVHGTLPWRVPGEVPPRCAVTTSAVEPVDLGTRLTTAWCRVEVVADVQGVRSVRALECSEGLAEAAVEAVASWGFPTGDEQRWEVLLGYLPATGHDLISFR